jgi:hypothetical protein
LAATPRTGRPSSEVQYQRRGASGVTSDSPSIEALEAEARYARERYQLYRAKSYGPRPTSEARLRELQRISEGADARLQRARRARAVSPDG